MLLLSAITVPMPAEPIDAAAAEADAEPSPDQLTIDDLAAQSQVPSRTIRFYQSKGVLPRPDIRGRVAYYGAPHVERLKLIASLQDRGLRMDAIRDVVTRIDRGELDVGEWLGLEAQLQQPWANDQPRTVTEEELYQLAGRKRAGLLNDLVRAGLVKRHGDVFLVTSPALLQISTRLEAAGVDLDTAMRGAEILRKHLSRTAHELTELFLRHAGEGNEGDYAAVLAELRPMAMESLRVIFGQAMEKELRHIIETGRTATVTRRDKRRERRGR